MVNAYAPRGGHPVGTTARASATGSTTPSDRIHACARATSAGSCAAPLLARAAPALGAVGPRTAAAVVALHALGFSAGYAAAKLLGIDDRAARTYSIEVGMQNSALGAVLVAKHFADVPGAGAPCAMSACIHSLIGSALAGYWRGRDAREGGAVGPGA